MAGFAGALPGVVSKSVDLDVILYLAVVVAALRLLPRFSSRGSRKVRTAVFLSALLWRCSSDSASGVYASASNRTPRSPPASGISSTTPSAWTTRTSPR